MISLALYQVYTSGFNVFDIFFLFEVKMADMGGQMMELNRWTGNSLSNVFSHPLNDEIKIGGEVAVFIFLTLKV